MKDKTISLPRELIKRLEEKMKEINYNSNEFKSVEEYVIFILEQTVSPEESEENQAYGEEEEKEVKERLKELGYL